MKAPQVVRDASEHAGLTDVTRHTLRHAFANRQVMNNVNLKTVQELMGNKATPRAMRYPHLAPREAAGAARFAGAVFVGTDRKSGAR